jgi:hypothetical protein
MFSGRQASLSIIMEYAGDGDLFQKICEHKKKRIYMDEKKVWKYSIQVVFKSLDNDGHQDTA